MPGIPPLDPALVSLHLQAGGPWSAEDLAKRLKVNRVTVQRALRHLGTHVVKLGITRRTRYALKRTATGRRSMFRITRLTTADTQAHEWAQLTALHGGWQLTWASEGVKPEWADRVHDRTGFCEGLPFFLTDLRPQGYLGRSIILQLPAGADWPQDPRNWNDDHVITYLSQHGEDLPGNLVLGDEIVTRAMHGTSHLAVTYAARETHYPEMASRAAAGTLAGSSVEGEQPKFTTWLRDEPGTQVEAVIVKFTDRLDTPTGRRWADLLAAEQIARQVVYQTSLADAEFPPSEIFDFDGRRYYQITRFDRIGRHGRRGLVSLRALHDAGFSGQDTTDWSVAAEGLRNAGWISPADLRVVRLRQMFGRLIGNTDMHFGNLAFYLEDRLPLRLAPLYDMLPMLWAPRPGDGEPAPEFAPQPPLPRDADIWPEAAQLAETFWSQVIATSRVSEAFRPHAAAALRSLQALRARLG